MGTAAVFPRLWAAIAPMCGGMYPYGGAGAAEQAHRITMPTWVFHAEPDMMVTISESERAVEAVKQANQQEVRFTRYADAPDELRHDCWTAGYAEQGLYDWMLAQCNQELAS